METLVRRAFSHIIVYRWKEKKGDKDKKDDKDKKKKEEKKEFRNRDYEVVLIYAAL